MTVGNGNVALHLSGSGRRAGDYKTPDGEIPNSFNRAGFAEAGVAYTADNGYFGGSFAYDKTHYGIPLVEEGETNLDPRRQIFTLRGERRNIGGALRLVPRLVRRAALPARRARRRSGRDVVQERHDRARAARPPQGRRYDEGIDRRDRADARVRDGR